MEGWIKLYRKTINKAFYKDSRKVHLWFHLLFLASYSDGREEMFSGKPIKLKAGQFTTGRKQLSTQTGINETAIERILTYFEKTEQQIEQQKSSTNRLITILNWSKYQQLEQQIEQQVNNNRTTSEQQVNNDRTHYKKDKKENNINNINNTLISEIEISDVPVYLKNYFKISMGFLDLFKSNLEQLQVYSTDLEKVKFNKWVTPIKLMIESDKRSEEDISKVWLFLKKEIPGSNGFSWKKNIRSTSKLREKFETLLSNANSVKQQTNGKSSDIRNSERAKQQGGYGQL